MERLLADAEKLTGVKYDINNLGDVYNAIHAIQGELGIAGVAAAEAEGTFTGSAASMKAAWQNLLADISLGNDITDDLQIVATSAYNFLVNNLFPMIGNVLSGLPSLIGQALTYAFENIPGMVDSIITFLNNLANGMTENSGEFFSKLKELGAAMVRMFQETDWAGLGKAILNLLWTGIQILAPKIWNALKTIATNAWERFRDTDWTAVGEKAIELIETGLSNLGSKIWEKLTSIGETAGEKLKGVDWKEVGREILEFIGAGIGSAARLIFDAITNLGSKATEWFKSVDWSEAGYKAMDAIINGIKKAPGLIMNAIKTIATTAAQQFKGIDWRSVGIQIITTIGNGLSAMGSFLWGMLRRLGQEAFNAILNIPWVQTGINIVQGIVSGILAFGSQIASTLMSFARNAWHSVTSFFRIGSPSKLMRDTVGKWIPLGIAEGIKMESGSVTDALDDIAKSAVASVDPTFDFTARVRTAPTQSATNGDVYITLNYDANADATDMVRDIARGVQRFRVAGAF